MSSPMFEKQLSRRCRVVKIAYDRIRSPKYFTLPGVPGRNNVIIHVNRREGILMYISYVDALAQEEREIERNRMQEVRIKRVKRWTAVVAVTKICRDRFRDYLPIREQQRTAVAFSPPRRRGP